MLGFLVPLFVGLALLAFFGHMTLVGTMRAWLRKERLFGRFTNWTRYSRVSGT